MTTLHQDAQDYVNVLNSQPNGWGQHVHPQFGQSHHMLSAMYRKHGRVEFDTVVDRVLIQIQRDAYAKRYRSIRLQPKLSYAPCEMCNDMTASRPVCPDCLNELKGHTHEDI